MPCFCPHVPRTLGTCNNTWISLKISRPMPQIDPWSSLPPSKRRVQFVWSALMNTGYDFLDDTLWHSSNSRHLPLGKAKTWQLSNISNNYRPDVGCHDCHFGLHTATAHNWMWSTRTRHSTYGLITMTSQWAWWRLRSPASRLFTQPFIRAQIKDNIKAPRHWPLSGDFTGDRWIPRRNGH